MLEKSITSIDKEELEKDLIVISWAVSQYHVPIIASGGMASLKIWLTRLKRAAQTQLPADILHYGRAAVNEIRDFARIQKLM